MPQQVLRFEPQPAELDADFAKADAVDAVFETDSDTVVITVNATNTGDTPIEVTEFTTSTLTFPVDGDERLLQVEPAATIAPGETATLKLSMQDDVWAEERLMPVGESRMQVTGVLRFTDSSGNENFKTVQSFVKPSEIT